MKRHLLSAAVLGALAISTQGFAAFLTPTLDGQGVTTAANGPSLAVQTATAGFGATLQLGELLVSNDGTNLYVSIPGNNANGGSGLYLLFDSVAGGATSLATGPTGGYGEFDALADTGGGNLPTGFTADLVVNLKAPGDGGSIGTWNLGTNLAAYRGNTGSYTGGYNAAQDNSNATAAPWASGAVSTGVELAIPLSELGSPAPGTAIKLFVISGNTSGGGANNTVYLSNQILPNSGTPGNFGRDGAGGGDGVGTSFNGTGGPTVVPANYVVVPRQLEQLWQLRAANVGASPIGNDGTNRSLTFNPATRNVIVTRTTGPTATVLNGQTGATVTSLNVTGITGGTFTLSKIRAVGTGGSNSSVYGVNLISDAKAASLKVYRWPFTGAESNSVAPTTIYQNRASDGTAEASPIGPTLPAAGALTIRLGDSVDAVSNGTTTHLLLTAQNGTNSNQIWRLVIDEATGTVTGTSAITLPAVTGSTAGRGITSLGLDSALLTSSNAATGQGYFPFDGTTVGTRAAYNALLTGGSFVSKAATVGGSNVLGFIDGASYVGGGFRRFGVISFSHDGTTYRDQSSWFGPLLTTTATAGVVTEAQANGNATGDVAFDTANGYVYALVSNNYIGAYRIPTADRTVRWDGGAGDGLWNSPANWSTNELPGYRDNVILDNTFVSGSYAVSLANTQPATAAPNAVATATSTVKSLQVGYAGNPNTITLNVTGTSAINLVVTGTLDATATDDIAVLAGGVVVNGSTATAGNILENRVVGSTTRVGAGGKFTHNTGRSFGTPFPATGAGAVTFESGSTFEFGEPAGTSPAFSGRTYGNVILANSAAPRTVTAAGGTAATIQNDLTIGTNVTFNPSMTGGLTIGGSIVNNGSGGAISSTGGSNTGVTFTGATAAIGGTGTALTFPEGITVAPGATVSVNQTLAVPAAKVLTANGAVNANGATTVAGTLRVGAAGSVAGSSTVAVASTGTVDLKNATGLAGVAPVGGVTFDPAATVSYTGAAAQSTGNAALVSVGTLTVDNLTSVSLSNALTAATLTLTNGEVYTGANTLTATTVNRTNGFVVGTLTRTVDATVTGARSYPIGNAGSYLPVTVDVTAAGTGTGTISAATTGTAVGNAPASADEINRQWALSSTGISGTTYTLTFSYADPTDLNGVDENTLVAARFDGANWETKSTTINAAGNTATATGVTAFSPWTLYKTNPTPGVSSATLAFGNVTAGNNSDLTVDVTNTGTAAFDVTALNISGSGFTIISPSVPFTVNPAASTTVTVRFAPATATAFSETLTVDTNAASDPTVSLTGTGVSSVSDWSILND